MWFLKAQREEIFFEDFSKEFHNRGLLLRSDLKAYWLVQVYLRNKLSLVDCQVDYEWIEEVLWK